MIGLILGNIMVVLGVFSIIKGKLPLIKRYNGVKNIKLHSRIEGTAILLVGIMLIFQCFISLGNVEIVIIILSICIFSFCSINVFITITTFFFVVFIIIHYNVFVNMFLRKANVFELF